MRLHPPLHFVVVEILPLIDKRLPVLVEGRIVQVLGGEGRCSNGCIAQIMLANDMLFYQFHRACLLSACYIPSCIYSLPYHKKSGCASYSLNPLSTGHFWIGHQNGVDTRQRG